MAWSEIKKNVREECEPEAARRDSRTLLDTKMKTLPRYMEKSSCQLFGLGYPFQNIPVLLSTHSRAKGWSTRSLCNHRLSACDNFKPPTGPSSRFAARDSFTDLRLLKAFWMYIIYNIATVKAPNFPPHGDFPVSTSPCKRRRSFEWISAIKIKKNRICILKIPLKLPFPFLFCRTRFEISKLFW